MGGRVALPEYDENMKRAADIANLTPKEVAKFLKYFKKLDKEKKGDLLGYKELPMPSNNAFRPYKTGSFLCCH